MWSQLSQTTRMLYTMLCSITMDAAWPHARVTRLWRWGRTESKNQMPSLNINVSLSFPDMGRGWSGQMVGDEQLESTFRIHLACVLGQSRIRSGDSYLLLWPHRLRLGRGNGRKGDNNHKFAHPTLGATHHARRLPHQRYRCRICTKISGPAPSHRFGRWHHPHLRSARHNESVSMASAARDCK